MPDIFLLLTWAVAVAGAALLLFVILAWWARRTPNDIDDVVVGVLQWPVLLFILLTALINLLRASTLAPEMLATLISIANILRIGIATWAAWRLTRDTVLYYGRQLARRSDSSFDDVLIPVLDVLSPVVIVGVGAIGILRLLGADISTVVLTTGGAAVIVGLALRDTLGNILGGLTLLIDTPFRFGDLIIWDGIVCEIRRIGLRVTTLYNTRDHAEIYVPNTLLAAAKITNLTRPSPDLRVTLDVAVPDRIPFRNVETCLSETADANPYILGNLASKLTAMRQQMEETAPGCAAPAELEWGTQALSRELALDDIQAQVIELLDHLRALIDQEEKGGLSRAEKAVIERDLDRLDALSDELEHAMRAWAETRTYDPHLALFPADRARLLESASLQVLAMKRHTSSLCDALKDTGLYEMQRLDDQVSAYSEWLPASFKPVTPAWKYPLVTLTRSSITGRVAQLVVYVDDIHLEGFVRRPRVISALSEAIAQRLHEVQRKGSAPERVADEGRT